MTGNQRTALKASAPTDQLDADQLDADHAVARAVAYMVSLRPASRSERVADLSGSDPAAARFWEAARLIAELEGELMAAPLSAKKFAGRLTGRILDVADAAAADLRRHPALLVSLRIPAPIPARVAA